MPVLMQFVSAGGTFTFDSEEVPLFARQIEYARQTDQGYAGRKILCSLNGFFAADSHVACIQRYQSLIAVIKANDARFMYLVDGTTIVDERVYLDSYGDPTDWKEYEGDYAIAFHYFELPTYNTADLGITAAYQNSSGQTYTFDPTPHWSASQKSNRPDYRAPLITPSGATVSTQVNFALAGRLFANNYGELKTKIDLMSEIFAKDGTLNYGSWSNSVRMVDLQIPSAFPRNYVDYTLTMAYDSSNIIDFRSSRKINRLHGSPIIRELPFCGTVRTKVFGVLGQTINYSIQLRAKTLADARNLLSTEAAVLILPGGIELEGGSEEWNYVDMSVSLSCSKYYYPAVVTNLAGS